MKVVGHHFLLWPELCEQKEYILPLRGSSKSQFMIHHAFFPVAWQTATQKTVAALSPKVSEWLQWAELPFWVDRSHEWDINLWKFMARRFWGRFVITDIFLCYPDTSRPVCFGNYQIPIKIYDLPKWTTTTAKKRGGRRRQETDTKGNKRKQVEILLTK